MKIAIEGQRLFREKKHGMDMVVMELINNLQKIDTKNEYVIYVKPDIDKSCLKETPNFRIVELPGGPYPLWEQYVLPKAVRNDKCDLLHCTSNTAPVKSPVPLVVTLHDIIYMENWNFLRNTGSWYQKLGNIYRCWVVPKVVKRSNKIITVSKFEKQRIKEYFNQPDNKLEAVYNGVGEHFKIINDRSFLDKIKSKYNLPDEFLFFLGNTDPKKNTIGVLKAYSGFLKITKKEIPLIMPDYDMKKLKRLANEIGDPGIMKNIMLTGYIKNTDLPGIYNLCKIFLYPSLRESFGIPILEAMACGVPVITGNTSSMPEIAGDAAILVDPKKPEEITKAMIKLFNEKEVCQELIKKGNKRAQEFSWESMAEDVLKIYQTVV